MTATAQDNIVLPGGAVGVLGGGQLGRMLAIAAKRMGYRLHVLDPVADCPTAHCGDYQATHPYDDAYAVRKFAETADVLTFEFENVPAETLEAITKVRAIHPSPRVLHTCRHRVREKEFLRDDAGVPVAPFHVCRSADDVAAGMEKLGAPCILKTAEFGYDGKGQVRIDDPAQAADAWRQLDPPEAVLEGFVPFDREMSIIIARTADGQTACFPAAENEHANHILDVTIAPARVSDATQAAAVDIATRIAERFDLIGVLAVELFLVKQNGAEQLIVNELAPRPHNSGHYTFDACVTSQFEQQLRAVCGLPLGDPSLLRPAAAMANLLGGLWFNDAGEPAEPDWPALLALPDVKLHLYGKHEARPGRKMGHLVAMADTPDEARAKVIAARDALKR